MSEMMKETLKSTTLTFSFSICCFLSQLDLYIYIIYYRESKFIYILNCTKMETVLKPANLILSIKLVESNILCIYLCLYYYIFDY